MEQGNRGRGFSLIILMGITVSTFAVYLIPFLFPGMRAWGVNNLLFLPSSYLWLFGVLACVTLLVAIRPVFVFSSYDRVARFLLAEQNWLRWSIVGLVSVFLFWLLRLPVYLLGDSYSVTANLDNDLPVIYKWSEIGAVFIATALSHVLASFSTNPGELSYNIIAVLSGGATVILFMAIAYELGKDATERLFVFGLSVCAGWILLFFGYTENYPALWPFMAGYIYFSIRHMHKKGSLVVPAAFLFASLVLHLQTLFFLFSFPIVIVAHGKPARLYHAHKQAVLFALGLFALSSIVLFAWLYQHSLEFRLYLIPLFGTSGGHTFYSLFSPSHFLDIGNQLLLLMPIFPVLLVAGWQGWKQMTAGRINQFLLLLTAGGLAFLFIIDPKLGMGRDWDLFALAGFPPVLLLARGVLAKKEALRRYYPALLLALLTMVLPFFLVNLNYDAAIHKFEFLLNLDMPKSRSGIANLRKFYEKKNNRRAVDSLAEVIVENFPAARLVPKANLLMDKGDLAAAQVLVDSVVALEPHTIEAYNLLGTLYLKQGRYQRAIEQFTIASRLGRYDSRPLANLALVYNYLGQPDRMMAILRNAQARNPKSERVNQGLATGFLMMKQYDSAVAYAGKLIKANPKNPSGYMLAGYGTYYLGDMKTATKLFNTFLQLNPSAPEAKQIKEILRMK